MNIQIYLALHLELVSSLLGLNWHSDSKSKILWFKMVMSMFTCFWSLSQSYRRKKKSGKEYRVLSYEEYDLNIFYCYLQFLCCQKPVCGISQCQWPGQESWAWLSLRTFSQAALLTVSVSLQTCVNTVYFLWSKETSKDTKNIRKWLPSSKCFQKASPPKIRK